MTGAEAAARLREAQRWLATLRHRQSLGIQDSAAIEARLQAEVAAAEQAIQAAVGEPAPDVVQREIETAEQLHRAARRTARRRQAAAVKAAQVLAEQTVARREQAAARRQQAEARRETQRARARAWWAQRSADVTERAGRAEMAGFPTELLQRSQDVRVPYAVSFRETYADDAFYFDAIAPYGNCGGGEERDDA